MAASATHPPRSVAHVFASAILRSDDSAATQTYTSAPSAGGAAYSGVTDEKVVASKASSSARQ